MTDPSQKLRLLSLRTASIILGILVFLLISLAIEVGLRVFENKHEGFGQKPKFEQGYYGFSPGMGPVPNEGHWTISLYSFEKQAIDTRMFTIDASHRRLVPGQKYLPNKPSLIFLGCSFVYGEGLGDDQTLSAQAYQELGAYPKFNVYTYSYSGWSPGNVLRVIEAPEFGSDLSKVPGSIAVFLFHDDLVNRLLGSIELLRELDTWDSFLPYYYLNSQGDLQNSGKMITQAMPWRDRVFRLLAKSRLLKALKINYPKRESEDALALVTAVMGEIRSQLKKKVNLAELYVVFFPGTRISEKLIPLFEKGGIHYLDYSKVDFSPLVNGPLTLPDGHPSAGMNEALSRKILEDLSLVKPEPPNGR